MLFNYQEKFHFDTQNKQAFHYSTTKSLDKYDQFIRNHNLFAQLCYCFRSQKLNDSEKIVQIQQSLPKLPILSWYERKNYKAHCAKYPDLYDIQFNNKYWQVFESRKVRKEPFDDTEVRANHSQQKILPNFGTLAPSLNTSFNFWISSTL